MKSVSVAISIFSSLSPVTKLMSHGLDLVQFILALCQHWHKQSLFDIKICHNQCKLVSANQRRYFIGVI